MKRGNTTARITTIVLGLFLVAYIGYQAYQAFYNPVRTVSAVYTEVDDTISMNGCVVRDENIFSAAYSGVLDVSLYEGERASNGSLIATVYKDAASAANSHKAAELDEQINQLTTLYSQSGENYDIDAANDDIFDCAKALVEMQQNSIFESIEAYSDDIQMQTMLREYIYSDKSKLLSVIDGLKKEKEALGAGKGIVKRIYSPYAGFFSQHTDGYENSLDSKFILSATPDEFSDVCNGDAVAETGGIGKLIKSNIWYYAAVIDESEAKRLKEGSDMKLKFADKELPEVVAELVRLSEAKNGKVLVVFECNSHIGYFTKTRKINAQAIVTTYSGLKVPREALRVDENGRNGVYCLIDSQVKYKPVNIIFEKDSYYISKYDTSDTKSLLLYDEIVVSAKNLKNRKVIK